MNKETMVAVLLAVLLTVLGIGGCCGGWSVYRVWERDLRGKAEANKSIGDSLKDNDAYLWYMWMYEVYRPYLCYYLWIQEIQGLNDGSSETTEDNLPILEAIRR